ncbi:Wzz/FepE/Etk N-terminal domain-containing protein [Azospirillum endophyticum]
MPDGVVNPPLPQAMTLALPSVDGEGDLRTIVRSLRAGWRWLLAGWLAGLALAVAALWLVTPAYTATMVIGPMTRAGSAAMGARVPTSGGRDSAAVAEPGTGDESLSDFARYLELFGSGPVAEQLAREPAILHALFPERWDPGQGRWRLQSGLLPMVKRALLALVGREDWLEPDGDRVARALRERLVIDMLRSGPMRRISIRHADRATAVDLLGRIAAATDSHLRTEAARRSAAQIAHIKLRLDAVTVAVHRQALSDLLLDQERVAMMIGVDLPFAADMIQPPAAGALPDWPNPAVVVPLAGLVGLVAAGFALSARHALKEHGAGMEMIP